jgi:PilZ domain
MKIRVRDISRGGINFLVDREMPPGTLVRIDLPRRATGGESIMLACVMHCRAQASGGYSIGCAFSDELGNDELKEFGGRREPARSEDKRAWARYTAHGIAEFETVPPTSAGKRTAAIANISPCGIGLLLDERIEPGIILDLLLKTKTGSQFDILACIVYLGSRPEGGWVAGCHFIRELEESDLKRLL